MNFISLQSNFRGLNTCASLETLAFTTRARSAANLLKESKAKRWQKKGRKIFRLVYQQILIFYEEKLMVAPSAKEEDTSILEYHVRAQTIMINVFNLDLLQLNVFIQGIYKLCGYYYFRFDFIY